MKFKIFTGKTPLAASRLTVERFAKTKAGCVFLIPRSLPYRVYLVPPCQSVWVHAYADDTTKFSRIDRFPFSVTMDLPFEVAQKPSSLFVFTERFKQAPLLAKFAGK